MSLPNFLIIGAAKAGTTSLYHYLRQHRDVFVSPVKEARYSRYEGVFKDPSVQVHTRESYERLFDGAESHQAIGEASPQYLSSPSAADRIREDLPDVRLIASLRNPADRAYSSYAGRVRGGLERRGVDEAMRPGTSYFESSVYYPGLSRYFARFERRRIKILLFEDFVANPRAVMRDLHEFLGVDASLDLDVTVRHNPGAVPRSIILNQILMEAAKAARALLPLRNTGFVARVQRPLLRRYEPLAPQIRNRLLEQFRDDIAQTEALIGRDLTHWLD